MGGRQHQGCRLKLLRLGRRGLVDLGAHAGLVTLRRGCRPQLLHLGRRGPVDLGAHVGLVSLGRGRRPELLRLGRRGPVDLGLASGLDGKGVLMVLVLADRDTHQEGSSCDHCRRGDIGGGSKPTTAFFRHR